MQKKDSDSPFTSRKNEKAAPPTKKSRKRFPIKKETDNTGKPAKATKKSAKRTTPFPFADKKGRGKATLEKAAQKLLHHKSRKAPKKQEEHKAPEVVYSAEEKFSTEIRLNKFISHAGIASRRKADELIKEGKVKVNGQVVTEMGHKVQVTDKVEFEGKKLNLEKKYYILLNKPKDFITTVNDERDRKTVMDLIRRAYVQMDTKVKPRLYPVGRLDRNTTGVLLITNDGELAQKLTHPSAETHKVYHVVLSQKLRKEDFDKIAEGGVVLEDGIAEVDEIAYPNPKNRAEVGVEIHTGKNRFVRRLFEALGYEVIKLDRVFFAGLTKKDLPRGRWRFLSEEEVRRLRYF